MEWINGIICKLFGHQFVQGSYFGGSYERLVIRKGNYLSRKGGKKLPILGGKHSKKYKYYYCKRCGLCTNKLRKGEKLYEGN